MKWLMNRIYVLHTISDVTERDKCIGLLKKVATQFEEPEERETVIKEGAGLLTSLGFKDNQFPM
jgi:hypothetical protein